MKRFLTLAVMTLSVTALVSTGWAGMKMMKGTAFPQGWRHFIHVKSMVIPDKSHGLYGFHHIYVNGRGLATLKKGGVYPEGSTFVGVFYDVVTEKDGSIHQGRKLFSVLMRKDRMAKDTGGWRYAAYDPEGKLLEKDVKRECFDCHTSVKDSDYIFSKFVE